MGKIDEGIRTRKEKILKLKGQRESNKAKTILSGIGTLIGTLSSAGLTKHLYDAYRSGEATAFDYLLYASAALYMGIGCGILITADYGIKWYRNKKEIKKLNEELDFIRLYQEIKD